MGRFGRYFGVVHYFADLWGDDGGDRPFRCLVIDSERIPEKILENSGKFPESKKNVFFFFCSELHGEFGGVCLGYVDAILGVLGLF